MIRGSEQDIINRIHLGDKAAFSKLVDEYKDASYTLCLRLAGHPEDAADICQDAFIKAYRALKSFRGDSRFSTWLYRIVYNTAISHLRSRKIKMISVEDMHESESWENDWIPEWEAEDTETKKKIIRAAVKELPEIDRTIITMFYLMEHSISEISQITEITRANVKIRLHRARLKLFDKVNRCMQIHSLQ
jgi:RNA polymerase sigma factor (sigma-70 family)